MNKYECVQCGYCCSIAPCAFGVWDDINKRCLFLTKENKCEKYDEIIKNPLQKLNPAFGYGCSSTLFNKRREDKIKKLNLVSLEDT